ncbi:ribosomal protein S18 acetylase RimI-like enzyme [Herbihabitans rhizosphaerae]|uniref:Ribosomal protein S18 acetylase RimI-like enzyme n=1 Tax=Herbihabitans rhizosphaerae TaxID=1872711 RepID=A0A4Q7L7Z1_9PSEU|nr:GNAT family N-acetyltransferase [Herbihabitans rhizosphaerae]RZS44492.1 ribosomal protein S18 acetylase RimI-like enzyme [Herbihabitans rhizosphaerae]
MTIRTRPATESDLPALLALYAELHPGDPAPSPDSALAVWRQIATQAGRTILVAESGDAVVGTVDCAVLPNLTRNARPLMLVENVVVTATSRGSGIGTALLTAAVALARSAGCYKIQLLSRASREVAHAFYESNGFRAVAQGYRLYVD